tara:strand:+ start:1009 stop:1602 length:594 start_codon:yes stop_codon:yes gene_type:complete
MKAFLGVFLGFIVASCASTSGTKVNVGNTPDADLVTLTSKCDKKCTDFIETTFPFKKSGSLFKKDAPTSYAILSEIDGNRGTSTHYDPLGSFNSSWDGGYNIQTSPGLKMLKIFPTATHMAPTEETDLAFNAQSGTTYFVATLFKRENAGGVQINYWSPIVLNLQTYEVILPEGNISWRKYCIAAREFSTSLPCPSE